MLSSLRWAMIYGYIATTIIKYTGAGAVVEVSSVSNLDTFNKLAT
jgi:hypothetical protein